MGLLRNNMMTTESKYKKGMVFGVFDCFHKGHEYFLLEAKSKCEELIVVVTLSEIVELIKKRKPQDSLEVRMENIKSFDKEFLVVLGDTTMGEWTVLKTHKPDVVFLGYDQQGIAGELDKLGVGYIYIESHYPEKYKTSLVRSV